MNEIYLSKSLFIKGIQCHKSLYLHKYHPEWKDPVPPSREELFESGSEVGIIAQRLFPGGINIPYEPDDYDKQIKLTQEAIRGGIYTIYEAAFKSNGVFVKTDILHKEKDGWAIYEVKSSTSLKDIYMPDAAIQYYAVKGSGLPVSRVCVIHINNQYIRQGDIEPHKLFTVNDITCEVLGMQDKIEEELERQKNMLLGDIPDKDIGRHCQDPYDCEFIGYCWSHIPEDSVFILKGNRTLSYELYSKGIINLRDIPESMVSGDIMFQVEAFLEKKIHISKESIRDFLDTMRYPLYFLDFETLSSPIPPFDGTAPYQHIPFQYSLHIIENEGSEPVHHEYIAEPGTDPRRELTERLLSDIPENACVIAYVANFEKNRLKELAEYLPEYRRKKENIIVNTIDLAIPFKKRYFYHWKQNGSYSLKAVLPLIVPELTYENLEIRDGNMAMKAYKMMHETSDPEEINLIRHALLEYCRLDTLAMIKIVERLKEMVG